MKLLKITFLVALFLVIFLGGLFVSNKFSLGQIGDGSYKEIIMGDIDGDRDIFVYKSRLLVDKLKLDKDEVPLEVVGMIKAESFCLDKECIEKWEDVSGGGYWSAGTSNNIYRLVGKVGIGTNSPSEKLDVNGNVLAKEFCLKDDLCISAWPEGVAGSVSSVDTLNNTLNVSPTTGHVKVSLNLDNPNNWAAQQTFSQYVGIGTSSPTTRLHLFNSTSGPIISLSGDNINYRGLTTRDLNNDEKWFMGNNDDNNFVIRRNSEFDDITISSTTGAISLSTTTVSGDITADSFCIVGSSCIDAWPGGGSGEVSSVNNDDGSLEIDPTTGAVIARLNLSNANNWTAQQNFSEYMGIGTSSPNRHLHIYDTVVNAELDLQSVAGANNHWSMYVARDSSGFNSFRLWGGDDYISVLRDGKVGIGTNAPSSTLHVIGNIIANDPVNDNHLTTKTYVDNRSLSWSKLTEFPNACPNGQYVTAIGGDLTCTLPPDSPDSLWLENGDSDIYRLDGKVGIGTSSPTNRLHLYHATSGPIIGLSGINSNYRGLSTRDLNNDEMWFMGNNNANDFVIRRNETSNDLTINSTTGAISFNSLSGTGNRCLYVTDAGLISAKGADCGTATGGDDLGNHIATQTLKMGAYYISNDGADAGLSFDSLNNAIFSGSVSLGSPATNTSQAVRADRSISPGTGLSGGGNLTTDLTLSLTNTGVTAGTYGNSTNTSIITIDAQGRITSANNTPISGSNWNLLGDDVYRLNGKVGIGTSSPTNRLHLYHASSGPIIGLSGINSNYRGLSTRDLNNDEMWFMGNNNANDFVIRRNETSDDLTINSTTGAITLSTTTVNGDITADSFCIGPDCIDEWGAGDSNSVYVGTTTEKHTGSGVGGYEGGNDKCNTAHPGSHMCSVQDILNSVNDSSSQEFTFFTTSWIVNGAVFPTLEITSLNPLEAQGALFSDCNGFNYSEGGSVNHRGFILFVFGDNYPIIHNGQCNISRYIACCK